MILQTSNSNMPKNYKKMHMTGRLKFFLDGVVLPVFFKHNIRERDVTIGVIDKEKMVLRFQGNDLGIISTNGTDFTFVSK
jgi:hypothetical protein